VRLTPLEIRKQSFSRRRFGGVDPEEVQDFINLVASEMESLTREYALTRERLDVANQKIEEFRTIEETLQRTLMRAEEMSSASQDHARRESELILQEAQLRAERILGDARNRLRRLTDEIDELVKKKDVFLNRFQSLVQMQLELLEQHRPDYDDIGRTADAANEALERHARPVELPREPMSSAGATEMMPVDDGDGPTLRDLSPAAEGLLGLGSDDDS